MDLQIPFQYFDNMLGGPATFMRNLSLALSENSINLNSKSNNIFFPIEYELSRLRELKRNGGKIIQRLDGIYYPEKHGDNYKNLNRNIKKIYQELSDHIIFQSEYSKQQCFELFGEARSYSIVYNGVDKRVFKSPETIKEQKNKIKFITTGNFRNLDMLEPVINALDSLVGQFDFELTVVGWINNEDIKKLLARDYVNYKEAVASPGLLAEMLCRSDCFFYSHLNPPCPNSVIEAISCGLPVIGFDSGSLRELTKEGTIELLAPCNDSIFQSYQDFDAAELRDKILKFYNNQNHFYTLAKKASDGFSLAQSFNSYLDIFLEHCGEITMTKRIKNMFCR